jgi:hypothetical protein
MANNIIKTFTIQVDTKSGKIAVDGLTKNFVKAETAFKKLNAEVQNVTTTGLNPLTGATGLAGAAVTELGRTISDVNYGFPAVANNISQLGSLFTILTAKAGGASKAFELMKKEMRGPLGILLAFQVFITLIEAISKGFFDTGKEAKKTTEELRKLKNELSSKIVIANQYLKILEDTNTSERKRATIIKELKKLVPTLKDEDFKYAQQLDIVKQKIIDYSIAQASRIEIDKLVEDNSSILAKRRRIDIINEIKNEEEKAEAMREFAKEEKFLLESTTRVGYGPTSKQQEKTTEDIKKAFKERSKTIISESDKILTKVNQLSKGLAFGFSDSDDDKKSREKRIKLFKQQILDFKSEEEKFRNEALESEAIYEEDKIEVRRIAALKNLEIKHEDFETTQSLRLQQYLLQLDLDKKSELAKAKTQEQKKEIEKRYYDASINGINSYNQSLIDANSNYLNAIDSANKSFSSQTKTFYEQQHLNDLQGLVKQLQLGSDLVKQFDIDMATNELDRIAAEDALRDQQFLREKLRLEKIIKLNKDRNLSTLEDEEKLTNLKIKYKQDEDKSFEKSEKTKLAIANQVGQAIIGIAGEGSAVGKAVAVAMAIMNTKEAITAALGAKPYGPWNIAQAVAVGAFGMKQVQEIMSTKLPVVAAGGGGAGASMSVSAPDFNVVGQGAGSQLAGVVGARFGEPIKAYVLSSDVSSAQELDRKIDSTATIG